jgi:photosystem II stability/assembly factor-like uncharacterized protein
MINAYEGWAVGGGPDWREWIRPHVLNRGGDPQGDHILATRDGGITWQDVTPPELMPGLQGPVKEAFGEFLDEDNAWVTYYHTDFSPPDPAIVWRTADGGRSWESSSRIPLSEVTANYRPTYWASSNGGRYGWLYAESGIGLGNEYFALYSTSDSGSSWVLMSDPSIGGIEQGCYKTGMDFIASSIGWITPYCNAAIGGAAFYRTEDGAATWEHRDLPNPDQEPDFFEGAFCRVHSPSLFSELEGALVVECEKPNSGTSRYLYLTIDDGETWQTSPVPVGEILFLDRSHAWVLGQNLYKTENGGQSWTWVKFVNWRGQFSFVNQLLGWAVARSWAEESYEVEIALVRTSDGAETWSELKPVVAP